MVMWKSPVELKQANILLKNNKILVCVWMASHIYLILNLYSENNWFEHFMSLAIPKRILTCQIKLFIARATSR